MEPLHPHQEDANAPIVREEWRRRRKILSIGRWTLLACAVGTFLSMWIYLIYFDDSRRGNTAVFFVCAMVLPLVLFLPFSYLFGRCPRCAINLTRVRNPRFCWNCGVRLREDDQ